MKNTWESKTPVFTPINGLIMFYYKDLDGNSKLKSLNIMSSLDMGRKK